MPTLMALLPLLLSTLPPGFHKPPYVQAVTTTTAVIMWEARSTAAATVTLTGSGGFQRRVRVIPRPDTRLDRPMAEVALEGLQPGTTYTWLVEQGGAQATGRVRTAPLPGAPFTFAVYGDNRSDHRAHRAVVEVMAESDPDLLISTGDLVGRGREPAEWQTFFKIEWSLLRRTPLFPVLGNHDAGGGGHELFARYFHLPHNEAYYSFQWGSVGFVAIDAEVHVGEDGGPDPEQERWLIDAVTRLEGTAGIEHVIGFVHRGPFTSNPRRTGNSGVRRVVERLHTAGLDLLLCGHDHYYERGRADFGLPYLVVGSGGAPLYTSGGTGRYEGFEVLHNTVTHAYVRLRSVGPFLNGCAVDLDGRNLDCFEIGARLPAMKKRRRPPPAPKPTPLPRPAHRPP